MLNSVPRRGRGIYGEGFLLHRSCRKPLQGRKTHPPGCPGRPAEAANEPETGECLAVNTRAGRKKEKGSPNGSQQNPHRGQQCSNERDPDAFQKPHTGRGGGRECLAVKPGRGGERRRAPPNRSQQRLPRGPQRPNERGPNAPTEAPYEPGELGTGCLKERGSKLRVRIRSPACQGGTP